RPPPPRVPPRPPERGAAPCRAGGSRDHTDRAGRVPRGPALQVLAVTAESITCGRGHQAHRLPSTGTDAVAPRAAASADPLALVVLVEPPGRAFVFGDEALPRV